jgi:hypothetical protein
MYVLAMHGSKYKRYRSNTVIFLGLPALCLLSNLVPLAEANGLRLKAALNIVQPASIETEPLLSTTELLSVTGCADGCAVSLGSVILGGNGPEQVALKIVSTEHPLLRFHPDFYKDGVVLNTTNNHLELEVTGSIETVIEGYEETTEETQSLAYGIEISYP